MVAWPLLPAQQFCPLCLVWREHNASHKLTLTRRACVFWCKMFSGMMQEISPIFGIGYYLMQFLGSQIGVMVFLVLLGQGMGKVDSLGMQQGLFAAEAPPPASDMEAPAADAPGATETL